MKKCRYIDKPLELVIKYNNTTHKQWKWCLEILNLRLITILILTVKIIRFKVGCHVQVSNYENIFS